MEGAERRDEEGTRLAMWAFILSEFLLFGGLFILYAGTRAQYPAEFHAASRELHTVLGVVNTLILLTSSLTAALSLSCLRGGDRRAAVRAVALTVLLGAAFMGIKAVEWGSEFREGLYPSAPALLQRPQGQILFFGFYFVMTGLHGLHVLAGMTLLGVNLALVRKGRVSPEEPRVLENSTLYWHLVDIIWIFLLPLLYLAA
jgi:cytochrome c oxidase subunit 3